MYVYMYVCIPFGSLLTLVTEQTYFKWWQKKPRHPLTFVYVALNQSHVSPSLSSKIEAKQAPRHGGYRIPHNLGSGVTIN